MAVKEQSAIMEDLAAEQLLLQYKETGDIALRNRIVMHYSSIAKTVAFQMRGIFGDYAQIEDIVNQGILALIECVERFDPSKQVKFQTFAYMRVRGSVIDFVRKQDWIPRRVRLAAKNINKAHDALCNEFLREPTHEEIAQRLAMPVDELYKAYGEISGAVTLSFEGTLQGLNYSDSDDDIEPVTGVSSAADAGIYKQELREVLRNSISTLTEREQQVVSLYYFEELKQSDIAKVLGISEQRVSQILARALQKVRYLVEEYMNS